MTLCAFLTSCQFRQPRTLLNTPTLDLSSSFPNLPTSKYLPETMKLRSGAQVVQVTSGGIAQNPKAFQAK